MSPSCGFTSFPSHLFYTFDAFIRLRMGIHQHCVSSPVSCACSQQEFALTLSQHEPLPQTVTKTPVTSSASGSKTRASPSLPNSVLCTPRLTLDKVRLGPWKLGTPTPTYPPSLRRKKKRRRKRELPMIDTLEQSTSTILAVLFCGYRVVQSVISGCFILVSFFCSSCRLKNMGIYACVSNMPLCHASSYYLICGRSIKNERSMTVSDSYNERTMRGTKVAAFFV